MSFVISSCLFLVKLAIAVTDGVYVMLSNVYSVIDSTANGEEDHQDIAHQAQETISESSRQPPLTRHSNILEAFNRRRANLAMGDQIQNKTPFDGKSSGSDSLPQNGKEILPSLPSCCVDSGCKCSSFSKKPHVEGKKGTCDKRTSKTLAIGKECPNTPSPKKSRTSSGKKAPRSSTKKKSRTSNLKPQGQDSHLSNISQSQARRSLARPSVDLSTTTDEDILTGGSASNRHASAKQDFTESLKYCKFSALSDISGGHYDHIAPTKRPRTRSPGLNTNSDSKSKASSNIDTVFQNALGDYTPSFFEFDFRKRQTVDGKNQWHTSNPELQTSVVNKFNNYSSEGSNSDCSGFGYFSDDGATSRVEANSHLNLYIKKPAVKNNGSYMTELMASEMHKKLHPVKVGHSDNLKESTSFKTSVKSLDLDSGYTSLSNHSSKLSPSTFCLSDENEIEQNLQSSRINVDLNQNETTLDIDKTTELAAVKEHSEEKVTETLNKEDVLENKLMSNVKDKNIETDLADTTSKEGDSANKSNCGKGSTPTPRNDPFLSKFHANNIPIRDLLTEEQQISFLNDITERFFQTYKRENCGDENVSFEECSLLQDVNEHHYTMLQNITDICQENMKTETENTQRTDKDPLTKMKEFELDLTEFIAFNKTHGYTYSETCSKNKSKLSELFNDEELDEFGFPLSSDDEDTDTTNVEEILDFERPKRHIWQRNKIESCDKEDSSALQEDIIILKGSTEQNSSKTEASTPISKDKKFNLTTVDLIPGCSVSNPVRISEDAFDRFLNSEFDVFYSDKATPQKETDEIDLEDGPEYSPETGDHEKNILDNSLGEKDWAECSAEVSKHYENCISVLDDDENGIHTAGDDSGCDDMDCGNTSSEDLMELAKTESEVDSIYSNLLRPGEMDVDNLLKELDAAFSTPMDGKIPTDREEHGEETKSNGEESQKVEKFDNKGSPFENDTNSKENKMAEGVLDPETDQKEHVQTDVFIEENLESETNENGNLMQTAGKNIPMREISG